MRLQHLSLADPRLYTRTNLRIHSHWPTMAAAAPAPNRPIKILMLHGYTQSGPLFQAKTGALRKTLNKAFPKGIELVYPTAPIRLTPTDFSLITGAVTDRTSAPDADEELDAWAWWRKRPSNDIYHFDGLDEGLGHIAAILKEQGPFDGVIGFSQGAAATAMVASLLEPKRKHAFDAQHAAGTGIPFPASFDGNIHPPLKFAVSYSGFAAFPLPMQNGNTLTSPYMAFYDPEIETPMLHFLGTQDVVIEEARSLALVQRCKRKEDKYVVYHPGGHFLPSTQKASVNALVGFIREVLWEQEAKLHL
ncbi:serine hydrolase FSH [Bipolaris maydis]|nr:serine hydrolase FSH [Bipolaris maydis]